MKKQSLVLLALVLCMAFVLGACGGSGTGATPTPGVEATPSPGDVANATATPQLSAPPAPVKDEVVYQIIAFPNSLDPMYHKGSAGDGMIFQIYDGLLFCYQAEVRDIRGLIAESYTKSEDGLTYTFKIREGIKFHNGDPVTLDDIVFSYRRWKEAPIAAEVSPVVESIEADYENHSVIIKASTAVPSALLQFMGVAILPESIYKDMNDLTVADTPETVIGAGAYRMTEFNRDFSIVLEAQDDYYGKDVYLNGHDIATKKVTYRLITDVNTAMIAFENGEIVSTGSATEEDIKRYQEKQKEYEDRGEWAPVRVTMSDSATKLGICFHCEDPIVGQHADGTAEEQEKALNLRRAIASAIDREAVNLALYQGWGRADVTQLPYDITEGYMEDITSYPYDVEKAKEYLEASGYKPGELKLRMIYIAGDTYATGLTTIVKDNLKKIGIELIPVAMEYNTWLSKMYTEFEFQMAYNSYTPVVLVPDTAYRSPWYSTSAWNPWRYNNPEVDKLIDDARTELDDEKRIGMYEEINRITTEAVVFVPLVGSRSATLVAERWFGYFTSFASNPKLFMMWWEEDGIWEKWDGLPYLDGEDLPALMKEKEELEKKLKEEEEKKKQEEADKAGEEK